MTAAVAFALLLSSFEVRTARDSPAERETRQKLLDVLQRYDLRKWTFTRTIVIDEKPIPHSHPVLTLGTGSRHGKPWRGQRGTTIAPCTAGCWTRPIAFAES
jgi:hypothetical protein